MGMLVFRLWSIRAEWCEKQALRTEPILLQKVKYFARYILLIQNLESLKAAVRYIVTRAVSLLEKWFLHSIVLTTVIIVHPGDVRRVEAVDCPKLRHLRNVIVFNTRGNRDLPNMWVLKGRRAKY